MTLTIRHCWCLKGLALQVAGMLAAEGFTTEMISVLRPGFLRLDLAGKPIWSHVLWRKVPNQQTLAGLVKGHLDAHSPESEAHPC